MIEHNFVEINQINGFFAFLWSIDWKDPWIIALCIFHITVTLMALLTRNYGNLQAVLFFFLLLLVYFSESINEIASTNWNVFSSQQYFDSSGLFISVVFSIPILLNCMLMVVCKNQCLNLKQRTMWVYNQSSPRYFVRLLYQFNLLCLMVTGCISQRS